ncbi:hypothetical protein MKW94_015727 [Papaver nudicaule]|uniref:TF-B3 domain-containing protein n=1 Tax=Papaver nudicaule TaxID=74823 RepID=A0AA41VPH8_PAPNU|nr:hypothetical protein [Papaver nudicaule]
MNFLAVLPKNCHHQLMLPKKFVKKCLVKEFSEISTSVSLKGPSGQVWAVELIRKDDEMYLKEGWDVFVKEHNLKENDRLFMTYKSGAFAVLMLDSGNFCEKESSYFVRNCQGCQRSNGGLNQSQRADPKCSEEVESEPSIEISDRRNSTADDGRTEVSVMGNNSTDSEEEINQVSPLAIVSRRRTVCKKRNHLTYQQAVREGNRRGTPHFVVLMQPSHVSRTFFMAIPAETARKYLPRANIDISLKIDGRTWHAKYSYYGNRRSSGFRGAGLEKFVRDNKLEVGNACLFETTSSFSASSSRTPKNHITFNVSIFRNVM